jgi:hypothetical protein
MIGFPAVRIIACRVSTRGHRNDPVHLEPAFLGVYPASDIDLNHVMRLFRHLRQFFCLHDWIGPIIDPPTGDPPEWLECRKCGYIWSNFEDLSDGTF